MVRKKTLDSLRIGFIGAGFIARFHLESFTGVRNCSITGVYSPTKRSRSSFAKRTNELGLGPCKAHGSLHSLINAKDIDALWILSPNYLRIETMTAISFIKLAKKTIPFPFAPLFSITVWKKIGD